MSLAGLRVVITRAKTQSAALRAALEIRGALVVEAAVLVTVPAEDEGRALLSALSTPDRYAWVVITSPNGADALAAALDGRPCDVPIAVVGPATEARLAHHGLHSSLIPETFVAEGLLDAFADGRSEDGSVLLAQADGARDVLAVGLAAKGWNVDSVVAYRTVPAEVGPDVLQAAAQADAIAFTSASTVTNFLAAAGHQNVPPIVACIGPITAKAARAAGLIVDVVADPHTIDGLVEALDAFVASQRAAGPHQETS